MQIRFVHHSCFIVELEKCVLIFDYFNGDRINGYQFHGTVPKYDPDTKLYLFASHSHQDHFDMDVLSWAKRYPEIHYIFSKDIRLSPNFLKKHGFDPAIREKILFVAPNSSHKLDDMQIKTLRSTDCGVAFLVQAEGKTFFHAGDLNAWIWDGAGDLINGQMKSSYRSQIRKLTDTNIDAAFIPMDPRLSRYQFEGIDFFLQNVDCDHVFPMHMWQDYSGIERYKKRIGNGKMADRIVEIDHEDQTFLLD